jgi:hypothetical protein
VDTELSSAAPGATMDSRDSNEKAIQSSASTNLSSAELRRVRVALGEYARQSGMHDPLDVLTFTRLCIKGASERLISVGAHDTESLLHEALRIASESCGVCKQRNGDAMSIPREEKHYGNRSDPVRAASRIVVRVAEPIVVVPVPEPHERTMPPQPLGELPDIRPAHLWTSLVQAAWRPVGTLLSSVFVRSEQ